MAAMDFGEFFEGFQWRTRTTGDHGAGDEDVVGQVEAADRTKDRWHVKVRISERIVELEAETIPEALWRALGIHLGYIAARPPAR